MPTRKRAVIARSLREYTELIKKYPKATVKLDSSAADQTQLFETGGMVNV